MLLTALILPPSFSRPVRRMIAAAHREQTVFAERLLIKQRLQFSYAASSAFGLLFATRTVPSNSPSQVVTMTVEAS